MSGISKSALIAAQTRGCFFLDWLNAREEHWTCTTFHSFLWDHYCFALLSLERQQRKENVLDKKVSLLQKFIKELCVCVCVCVSTKDTTPKNKQKSSKTQTAVMFTKERLHVLFYEDFTLDCKCRFEEKKTKNYFTKILCSQKDFQSTLPASATFDAVANCWSTCVLQRLFSQLPPLWR